MKNELPEADFREKAALFFGYRERFLVEGDSMLPTLKNGDFVLIDPSITPQVGDIVFAKHPFERGVNIVKRVGAITENGYYLVGDNGSDSNDSRTFGAVRPEKILGVAVSRF